MALVKLREISATVRSVINSSVDSQDTLNLIEGDTVDVNISSSTTTGDVVIMESSGIHHIRWSSDTDSTTRVHRIQVPSGEDVRIEVTINTNDGTVKFNPNSGTQQSFGGTGAKDFTFSDPGYVDVLLDNMSGGSAATLDLYRVTLQNHPTGSTATTDSISKQ